MTSNSNLHLLLVIVLSACGFRDSDIPETPSSGETPISHEDRQDLLAEDCLPTPDSAPIDDFASDDFSFAVLEGRLLSTEVTRAEPQDFVSLGQWEFSLNKPSDDDELLRQANIVISEFSIRTEEATTDSLIEACRLEGALTVELGSPDGGTLSSEDPLSLTLEVGQTIQFSLICQVQQDARLGTKITTSLRYSTSGERVYDASTADTVHHTVQIGPSSCGYYNLQEIFSDISGATCSRPILQANGTLTIMRDSNAPVETPFTMHILDGIGDGVTVNDLFIKITDIPTSGISPAVNMELLSEGHSLDNVPCVDTINHAGDPQIHCIVEGIDLRLIPRDALELLFVIRGIPEEVASAELDIMLLHRWTDVATGSGTSSWDRWPNADGSHVTVGTLMGR